jgi:O-antigen/teichoic acid export membrane protein
VGVFSAAVRISEVWYFIPVAIVASVFPSIIEAKKHSEALYYQRLQKLYDLMVILALSVAIPMTFLSHWLAVTLFGETYEEAGAILSIHIWASVFVFLGVASSKWFLIENMQKKAFYRTLFGMLINITANYFLIPSHGAIGAAISTLLSQILAAYLFDALTAATRRSFWLKTASLIPLNFIRKKASDFNNY